MVKVPENWHKTWEVGSMIQVQLILIISVSEYRVASPVSLSAVKKTCGTLKDGSINESV